ncbi:MAG: helix-turn-helix transcriptional regulator [Deltaproteobacteria bacterium]|nr:helix-turn-helix transcriptional regulator [Deltaproteobacteria bacterium]
MLAVVKTPHIDIRVKGRVPPRLLRYLKEEYGEKLSIEENEPINFFETKLYREIKKDMTPGYYVRVYRENRGFTQQKLGKKVGVSKSYICDIENNRRSISKMMAKKFSKLFALPIGTFIV